MHKWLAIAGALVLVMLLLLWKSIDDSSATPVTTAKPQAAGDEGTSTKSARADVEPEAPAVGEPASEDPPATGKVEKIDHMSDEFFERFTERVPKVLSQQAVECYNHRTGTLHRNQKLVLAFNVKVRDGKVTVHDVKVKPPDEDDPDQKNNTLNDPALESCFIQKVSRSTWTDESLPDYDWPDQLVIRPERGLKKYWKSNQDYVGAEAPQRDRSVHAKPPPVQRLPDDHQD